MKHLNFNVNSQSLQRLDNFKPAAGSVEYLTASFSFNSDWSGTTKTAKCRTGSVIYDAVISADGSCTIPWEVLAVDTTQQMFGKQDFYIWVEGINGTKTITTDEVKIELNVQGAGSEQNASEPTETVYAQFVADVKAETKANADIATARAATATASAARAAASAASLKNDYSNALKGNASGAVVRVDDVSPVEHNPKAKVICPENVDPSTVTVTRCGKNLLPLTTFTTTPNTTTATVSNGVLTVNGYLVSHRVNATGLVGKTLTISCNSSRSGEKGGGLAIEFRDIDNNRLSGVYKQNELSPRFSFVVPDSTEKIVVFFYAAGNASEIGTAEYKNVLLELGDSITEYEPYNGAEYTPNADGTVEGLTSVSPTMTLLTDTANMTVDCEYNRDINKVIADIYTQLAGGET